ncbi:hypothetical protein [Acinetobacter sp. FDAARGOS_515]|uniref:hypothetical protein n=1 Tax=Acinetobacter sp. FDAARGOS_515 TaxID=2420307 RepID=UPI000F66BF95|nr:hypothetical protein [Acinetobacter sp. FDAARGOS_515]RSC23561.1 hypothetical protein EGS47_12795 [Acinetobacter sp. FDAARGOS_515]
MKINTSFGELILLTNCPLLETKERLEFKTDVHASYDGSAEERIPLRDQARQSFTMPYVVVYNQIAPLYNSLYEGLRKEFAIPQVLEREVIPDINNQDFIEFDTSLKLGYMPAKSLALIDSNEGKIVVEITEIGRYQVIDEETVYVDGYRLNQAITATNATITPIRRCIIDGDVGSQINGLMMKSTVNFRVIDNPEYENSPDPEQFKGDDLYFIPLLLDGDYLDISFTQLQSIVDGDTGLFGQFTPWLNPQILKNLRVIIKTRQEFNDYKKWFYRRRGKLNQFWLPTYEQNLNLVSRSGSTITVKDDNYLISRKHIAIKANDVWSAHEVTYVSSAADNKVLTLNPEPPVNIQRISYLGLYRLNSDSVEFNFLGADIVEAVVPILELSP